MSRKQEITYKVAKEKITKSGSSVNNIKEHLRKLYIQNTKNLRGKNVDALRRIKEEISSKKLDKGYGQLSQAEMLALLDEIELEMEHGIEELQVLAYEDETQSFLDYMQKEDITCRRCGVSSHKNINDEHKCFNCGYQIYNL